MSDEPYQRKRRYLRYRIPGHGLEINEVASGPDAPYERRDARFWWGFVVVIVVVAALVVLAATVGG